MFLAYLAAAAMQLLPLPRLAACSRLSDVFAVAVACADLGFIFLTVSNCTRYMNLSLFKTTSAHNPNNP